MKNETKVNEKPVLQKIANKLLAVQQELDELVVQFSLGRAEAKEKFEEVKNEFRHQVSAFKRILEASVESMLSPEARQKIEELQVQLALGKAESKELFEEQVKQILRTLSHVEAEIKGWNKSGTMSDDFYFDAEKFRLKLEIIRLKFDLKRYEMKDSLAEALSDVRKEIERVTNGIRSKLKDGSSKYTDFRDEMSLAYKHLKKALSEL